MVWYGRVDASAKQDLSLPPLAVAIAATNQVAVRKARRKKEQRKGKILPSIASSQRAALVGPLQAGEASKPAVPRWRCRLSPPLLLSPSPHLSSSYRQFIGSHRRPLPVAEHAAASAAPPQTSPLLLHLLRPLRPTSSMAKIRSEVLSPFRSVRMFFYLAFMASGALGGLIALTQLIPALASPARAAGAADIFKGLGIDVAAVLLFAFLYSRESKARNAQVAKLTREENLSRLKLRVGEGSRVVPLSELRGSARLVIVAGPAEFVAESFRRSKPFLKELMQRGVLVVPFLTDGSTPALQFDESEDEDEEEIGKKSQRLWQLTPVYTSEWAKWLDEQKKLANVPLDSPVYLSLRMDGRVRGSGVGYPPWQAFVAQLPPVNGMWSGLLDGMDGRVL